MSNGQTPSISVIIPVFADEAGLVGCLEALSRQDLAQNRFEVVVVDNDSPEPLNVNMPDNAILLTETKPGSYHARNRGLEVARANILAFTDADCLPEPDWLSSALEIMNEDPTIDLIGGAVDVFPRDPGRPTPVELYELEHAFTQELFVAEYGFAATANLIARRAVFDDVGSFDARLRSGGDVDLGNRAVAAGFRLAYREDVKVRHPARRTVGGYSRRLKRTISGARDIADKRGEPYPFAMSSAMRELVPPIPTVARLLADRSPSPMLSRLKLAYGTVAIHYARTYHKFAVRFDQSSPRE